RSETGPGTGAGSLIPRDLRFATGPVRWLREAGFAVRSVGPSVWWGGVFEGTDRAARVQTDHGLVTVVIFATTEDAQRVRGERLPDGGDERFRYALLERKGSPPRWIDAAGPIYFLAHKNAFIITSDRDLARRLEGTMSAR